MLALVAIGPKWPASAVALALLGIAAATAAAPEIVEEVVEKVDGSCYSAANTYSACEGTARGTTQRDDAKSAIATNAVGLPPIRASALLQRASKLVLGSTPPDARPLALLADNVAHSAERHDSADGSEAGSSQRQGQHMGLASILHRGRSSRAKARQGRHRKKAAEVAEAVMQSGRQAGGRLVRAALAVHGKYAAQANVIQRAVQALRWNADAANAELEAGLESFADSQATKLDKCPSQLSELRGNVRELHERIYSLATKVSDSEEELSRFSADLQNAVQAMDDPTQKRADGLVFCQKRKEENVKMRDKVQEELETMRRLGRTHNIPQPVLTDSLSGDTPGEQAALEDLVSSSYAHEAERGRGAETGERPSAASGGPLTRMSADATASGFAAVVNQTSLSEHLRAAATGTASISTTIAMATTTETTSTFVTTTSAGTTATSRITMIGSTHISRIVAEAEDTAQWIQQPPEDASVEIRYLPKRLHGKPVLVHEGGHFYRADNAHLRSDAPGLGFRRSKHLHDRDPSAAMTTWGGLVQGEDEGDGWVKVRMLKDLGAHGIRQPREDASVGMRFLPTSLHGKPVLVHEGGNFYRAVNANLRSDAPGLGFRLSKHLDDRDTGAAMTAWGVLVEGEDDGDGWVKVQTFKELDAHIIQHSATSDSATSLTSPMTTTSSVVVSTGSSSTTTTSSTTSATMPTSSMTIATRSTALRTTFTTVPTSSMVTTVTTTSSSTTAPTTSVLITETTTSHTMTLTTPQESDSTQESGATLGSGSADSLGPAAALTVAGGIDGSPPESRPKADSTEENTQQAMLRWCETMGEQLGLLGTGLAPGWEAARDERSQRLYYFKRDMGQSQWEPPCPVIPGRSPVIPPLSSQPLPPPAEGPEGGQSHGGDGGAQRVPLSQELAEQQAVGGSREAHGPPVQLVDQQLGAPPSEEDLRRARQAHRELSELREQNAGLRSQILGPGQSGYPAPPGATLWDEMAALRKENTELREQLILRKRQEETMPPWQINNHRTSAQDLIQWRGSDEAERHIQERLRLQQHEEDERRLLEQQVEQANLQRRLQEMSPPWPQPELWQQPQPWQQPQLWQPPQGQYWEPEMWQPQWVQEPWQQHNPYALLQQMARRPGGNKKKDAESVQLLLAKTQDAIRSLATCKERAGSASQVPETPLSNESHVIAPSDHVQACEARSFVSVAVGGAQQRLSPGRRLSGWGASATVGCSTVNPSYAGDLRLTCHGGILIADATGCALPGNLANSPAGHVPSQCNAQFLVLRKAYAAAYTQLGRLASSYKLFLSSTACEDAVDYDYKAQRTALQERSMRLSAHLMTKQRELADVLKPELEGARRSEKRAQDVLQALEKHCQALPAMMFDMDAASAALHALQNCPGLSMAALRLPRWIGAWVRFRQNQSITDQETDLAMQAACADAVAEMKGEELGDEERHQVRPAEVSEIEQQMVDGMPHENTADFPLLGGCPDCAGRQDAETGQTNAEGHSRICWDSGASLDFQGRRLDCSFGTRALLCVRGETGEI